MNYMLNLAYEKSTGLRNLEEEIVSDDNQPTGLLDKR
jgi:hypothetical protein